MPPARRRRRRCVLCVHMFPRRHTTDSSQNRFAIDLRAQQGKKETNNTPYLPTQNRAAATFFGNQKSCLRVPRRITSTFSWIATE